MEQIGKFVKLPPKKASTSSERAELVGFFADEINRERQGTKYGMVS
jgi:hypothetical protein